jgi:large subunit ribosomal protein L10
LALSFSPFDNLGRDEIVEKAQKIEQIDSLKGIFSDVESVVLASVAGLNAAEVAGLRRQLHEAGVGFRVIKNNLARIASQDFDIKVLADDFVGTTALAWSKTDAVAPAKVLVKFQDGVEKFQIKAGFNAGKRLDVAGVKALSKMPSLEELRAQLLGLMQSVPARLLAQVSAPASHVVGVLQAKCDKEKEAA